MNPRSLAWAPRAVTAAAMIATPLASRGGSVRRVLSSVVVSGLAATTATATARRWGAGRAATSVGAIAAATAVVERIGTRTVCPSVVTTTPRHCVPRWAVSR